MVEKTIPTLYQLSEDLDLYKNLIFLYNICYRLDIMFYYTFLGNLIKLRGDFPENSLAQFVRKFR
jgi:hypothetical protein